MAREIVSGPVVIEGIQLECPHCKTKLFVSHRSAVWLGWLPWGFIRRRQAKAHQCLRCGLVLTFR